MQITLPSEVEQFVRQKLDSGAYSTAEDVVSAALNALQLSESYGEFGPGELDALLAAGEASLRRDGPLDGEAAYQARRERRARAASDAK